MIKKIRSLTVSYLLLVTGINNVFEEIKFLKIHW